MASKKSIDERTKETVAAVLAAEAEADGDAWEHETIDDIEDAMVRIGDLVAREVGVQKLARHTEQVKDDRCPRCGRAGDRVEDRDREIITRRGTVAVGEAKYHFRKCRRDFFPQTARLGIEAHYAYTPRMYQRVVFAAAHSTSFEDASAAMRELAELPLLPKRIWRSGEAHRRRAHRGVSGRGRLHNFQLAIGQYLDLVLIP